MPTLTDKEKQDIQRYLDADKPLPDKYRFLLFDDKREVELVWHGKSNEVCNAVLPFQTIEQVDEPRAGAGTDSTGDQGTSTDAQLALFDDRGRQQQGWSNKLIWGDNKLILSALKNGPMRQQIEDEGGLKLIYIDPPFDVGADFSIDIEVGDGGDTLTKQPGILEEIAYRDTWGGGQDSFIAMIYERLLLMRGLLAEDGSIYVHCDWRVNSLIRLVMNEIFGRDNLINVLSWKRYAAHSLSKKRYDAITDSIVAFAKAWPNNIFELQFGDADNQEIEELFPHIEEGTGRRFQHVALEQSSNSSSRGEKRIIGDREAISNVGWRWTQETFDNRMAANPLLIYWARSGRPRYKLYADEYKGRPLGDLWADIGYIAANDSQSVGYPTQKPEALLERIIKASSNKGDLVADFFCGSGTTAAVAEKLGRKWIVSDLGKFAIHTTRKRMIGVQRQLKKEDKDYRAFEILNLGKYERQHYIGINPNLREAEQAQQLAAKEAEFLALILNAYKAAATTGFRTFHGKKSGRMVVVGPVNLPVTRLFVEEVILEARNQRISKVDILGFEFEMGLFPNVLAEALSKGVDIAPKYIPTEVFDKRAVERDQVVFHDVAYLEAKAQIENGKVAVELTDFSVFYAQGSIKQAEDALAGKKPGSRVIVEKGRVIKLSKNQDGVIKREVLTPNWTDWIDYWSVDFDFEGKRGRDAASDEREEIWTGKYVFENEWQSFRTRKDRSLELKSALHPCAPGRRKIAVKVVDIFGNDTMALLEVMV